jgi:two-component system, NarL family, response regulator DevR
MGTAVKTKVFIAEDSATIRANLGELLQFVPSAVVVGEATSPLEAIGGILETLPDVVILDLHLLGGSGLEVLRALHPKLPGMTFVVLTNHPTAQYRTLCLEAGASHFLDKSNEFIRVMDLVRSAPRGCAQSPCTTQSQ